MSTPSRSTWNRRKFLQGIGVAGTAGMLGLRPATVAAEPPPETTSIRLISDPEVPVLCYAPQYVAEQFLRI